MPYIGFYKTWNIKFANKLKFHEPTFSFFETVFVKIRGENLCKIKHIYNAI